MKFEFRMAGVIEAADKQDALSKAANHLLLLSNEVLPRDLFVLGTEKEFVLKEVGHETQDGS